MDKISVIVPICNAEKTLKRCIDSLINQTYKNMEIILINDGSTDKSIEIINNYKINYPKNISVIDRENRGIGASRNEGLEISTGNYIGFVDSDDYVELNMYEELYNNIKKTNSDIAVCDYFEFGSFNKRPKHLNDFNKTTILQTPSLITTLNTAPWNKLYKKKIFDNLRFPENLKYEDLSTMLIAFYKAKNISKLNIPLYDYYFNPKGETGVIDYRVFDIFKILNIILSKFPRDNKKISRELLKLSLDKFYPYIIAMYNSNDRELMMRFVDKGFEFFNNNFRFWKLKYIANSKGIKNLAIRTMQTIKPLYKRFISKRVLKTKKKVLFTSYDLNVGGIEKALVNMVNSFDFEKYDITVLLQHKKGDFLSQIDSRANVEGFNLSSSKKVLYRKIINLLKILNIIVKNNNKYDFSACFGTGYKASSIVALYASKNNATWMHTNIITYIKSKNPNLSGKKLNKKIITFLNNIKFRKFKNYLFVSNNAMEAYLRIFPEDKKKSHLCYNFIDYKSITEKSKEKIAEKKNQGLNIINISRHTEFDKKISRIINAIDNLKNKYKITLYLVGDGADHQKLINMVKEKKLTKNVKFLGNKSNPYPYYLLGDVFVLSSAFEGFPTVYTEALSLNIPIITTNVSDAKTFIDKKYGIVCDNNDESLVEAIELFLKSNFVIKKKFDPKVFNEQSKRQLEELINND